MDQVFQLLTYRGITYRKYTNSYDVYLDSKQFANVFFSETNLKSAIDKHINNLIIKVLKQSLVNNNNR